MLFKLKVCSVLNKNPLHTLSTLNTICHILKSKQNILKSILLCNNGAHSLDFFFSLLAFHMFLSFFEFFSCLILKERNIYLSLQATFTAGIIVYPPSVVSTL